MSLNNDSVCYNRDTWKDWKIGDRKINRWVFAYTAENIGTVSRWKVDRGGTEVSSFEPAVQYALSVVVNFNASTFFHNVSQAQVDNIVGILLVRKSHMSLYAITDALECLMQREEPCIIDTFGFDAKAIMQACDAYWKKAKAEYYEWEKERQVKQAHDLKPGDPVPAYVTELREKLESKFGVVYDEEGSIEAMRAAAARYKAEQDFAGGFS